MTINRGRNRHTKSTQAVETFIGGAPVGARKGVNSWPERADHTHAFAPETAGERSTKSRSKMGQSRAAADQPWAIYELAERVRVTARA